MNEWIEVIGTQPTKPLEVDTTSSSFYIYERKDIQEYKDPDNEEDTTKKWKYLERKIPRDKWIIETVQLNKENTDAIMQGMVDLYELQLEGLGE